jgi:hypothetical protein
MSSKAGTDGKESDGKPANEVGEDKQSHSFSDPVKMQNHISFKKLKIDIGQMFVLLCLNCKPGACTTKLITAVIYGFL